jgi:hypothetical protein
MRDDVKVNEARSESCGRFSATELHICRGGNKKLGNEPHARPLTQASIHPRESFEIMLKFVGSYCSRGGQRGGVPCDRLRG